MGGKKNLEFWMVTYQDLSNFRRILPRLQEVDGATVAVVDNSCNESTKSEILNLLRPQDRAYFPDRNLYCCLASQYLLDTCQSEFCAYLCAPHVQINDPTWVDDALRVLEDRRIGIAGDVIRYPGFFYYQSSWSLAGFPEGHPSFFPNPSPKLEGRFSLQEIFELSDTQAHVQGGIWVSRTETLKNVGGFDTSYTHRFMDIELSVRIQCYGYRLGQVDSVKADYRSDITSIDTKKTYKAIHIYGNGM